MAAQAVPLPKLCPKGKLFSGKGSKFFAAGYVSGARHGQSIRRRGGSEPSGARKPACRASSCDSRRAWTRQPMAYGGSHCCHCGAAASTYRWARSGQAVQEAQGASGSSGTQQAPGDRSRVAMMSRVRRGKLGIHGRGAGPGIEPQFFIGHPDDFAVHAAVQGMAVPQALVFSRWQRGAVHRGKGIVHDLPEAKKGAGRPAPGWRCDGGYFSRPCRVCLPLLMVWSNSCCRESISSLTETMLLTRATLAPQKAKPRSRLPFMALMRAWAMQ